MSASIKKTKRKVSTRPAQHLERQYKRYFVPFQEVLYSPSVYFQQPTIYVSVPTVTTYGAYEDPI